MYSMFILFGAGLLRWHSVHAVYRQVKVIHTQLLSSSKRHVSSPSCPEANASHAYSAGDGEFASGRPPYP